MPFAKISAVEGWEDFGFKFKEGNNETGWDDEHGIITFRYTEPMTWWMRMATDVPRTLDAALAEAKRRAEKGDRQAQALLNSGYHNEAGQFPARLLDTPWCNGAVWSMNSMPAIQGEATDFKNKWNPSLETRLYGAEAAGKLDGEYVDSSEGYVTDELDFRRDHFAAAETPLAFSPESHKPAVFRRADRLRVRARHRPRRTRNGQADDGQQHAHPSPLAGADARGDGHGNELEPRRPVAGRCPTPTSSTAGRCARANPSAS